MTHPPFEAFFLDTGLLPAGTLQSAKGTWHCASQSEYSTKQRRLQRLSREYQHRTRLPRRHRHRTEVVLGFCCRSGRMFGVGDCRGDDGWRIGRDADNPAVYNPNLAIVPLPACHTECKLDA